VGCDDTKEQRKEKKERKEKAREKKRVISSVLQNTIQTRSKRKKKKKQQKNDDELRTAGSTIVQDRQRTGKRDCSQPKNGQDQTRTKRKRRVFLLTRYPQTTTALPIE
jgi:hypothetical protein